MRFRVLTTFAVAAGRAAAVVVGGCGSDEPSEGVTTLQWFIFNEPSGAVAAAAERCSEQSEGRYRIEFSNLPASADQQREQLVRRLAAEDERVDLIGMDVVWTGEFANAGWLEPVPENLREGLMLEQAARIGPTPDILVQEDTARLGLESGDASFKVNYPFVYPSAKQNAPGVFAEMTAAKYPKVVDSIESKPLLGGMNRAVSRFSEHKEVAFEAIECLVQPDNQLQIAREAGLPPVREDRYERPVMDEIYPGFADLIHERASSRRSSAVGCSSGPSTNVAPETSDADHRLAASSDTRCARGTPSVLRPGQPAPAPRGFGHNVPGRPTSVRS